MGTIDRGFYLPSDLESGWGPEVDDNFRRVADLALNVKAYGAVADGSTDATAAFQSAHGALGSSGSVLYVPAGTYKVQGLNWTTGNTVIQGAGRERTILKTTSGDLLNIGTVGSNIANLTMRDLTLWSASGGGDVLTPKMGSTKILDRAVFERVSFQQDNNASRIFDWDGPGLIDVTFSACQFQHTAGGTVNPMYFRSSQGDLNTVKFMNRCRATFSGEHFFYVESTAAASYAYDWHWEDFTGEVLVGGFLDGRGMFMPRLVKVGNYDMAASGTAARDFVKFGAGSGGAPSRKVVIEDMIRANGSLAGGFVDINFTDAEVFEALIRNCDSATVSGFTIDVGLNHGVIITSGSPTATINNRASSTVGILGGTAATQPQVQMGSGPVVWKVGGNTPEGAVTAPIGSLFSRTNGGAGTSFYVKESGSGDTGWVAK